MNKIISTIKVLLVSGILLTATSCEDFMSTDTNRYMLAEDNLINSPNDTVYSMLGILNKVQQLADKYVLIGELRGDLLDITDKTSNDLRNLSNYSIDVETSQFSDTKDFYAIINNCNYFISRADTNIAVRGEKSFVREVNAAKTIRAWTYLQLGLNYGKARYFDKPILTVDDLKQNYTELTTEQLIEKLISELGNISPMTNIEIPRYGTINEVESEYLFINPRFLLGDLYLWRGGITQNKADYEMAASYYAHLIKDNYYLVAFREVKYFEDTYKSTSDSWSYIFRDSKSNSELISMMKLAKSTYSGTTSQLPIMSKNQELKASDSYINLSDSQVYCLREPEATVSKFTTGDLRLKVAVAPYYTLENNNNSQFATIVKEDEIITKYLESNIMIYRTALLYLRYAEAVNRAEKPSLAFSVLKYGLKAATIGDATLVAPHEVADMKPYVTVFSDEFFNYNTGIHSRGSGNSEENTFYVIPDFTRLQTYKDINNLDSVGVTSDPVKLAEAKSDSILFVENAICDELALETAMEGNRFQDLMRIATHCNDPTFLAKKVAKKHSNNYNYYLNLLSSKENWYLPMR